MPTWQTLPAPPHVAEASTSWTLEVRDTDYSLVGEVSDYAQLHAVARFNDVGSWTMDADASSSVVELLTKGRGIVLSLDGTPVLSGPMTKISRSWNGDSGTDTYAFTGSTDEAWLAWRIVFPLPPDFHEETAAYDIRTGAVSTVMCQYVNVNLGAGAATYRRLSPDLEIVDPGVGGSVTAQGRLETLLALLQKVSLMDADAGEIGFRVIQDVDHLVFEPYEPVDRTAPVIFDAGFGSIASFEFEEEAGANAFMVAGIFTGPAAVHHVFMQGEDPAKITEWGARIELFDDRGDTEQEHLDHAITEDREREAGRNSITVTPIDTGALQFGRDYQLGDKVTTNVDGTPFTSIVREVEITLDEGGAVVLPTVGTPGATNPHIPALFRRSGPLAGLDRRMRELERKVNP